MLLWLIIICAYLCAFNWNLYVTQRFFNGTRSGQERDTRNSDWQSGIGATSFTRNWSSLLMTLALNQNGANQFTPCTYAALSSVSGKESLALLNEQCMRAQCARRCGAKITGVRIGKDWTSSARRDQDRQRRDDVLVASAEPVIHGRALRRS